MTEPIFGAEVFSQKLVSQAQVRKFVSRNSRGYLAIGIVDEAGEPLDPTDGTLGLKVYRNLLTGTEDDVRGELIVDTADPLSTAVVSRDDVGKYHLDIGPAYTGQRGLLTAEWTYTVDGEVFSFQDNMQIMDQMPNFDRLRQDTKLLVEQASWFFADMFDSTTGGPWLTENFQTHFDYDRIAFLMGQAVMKFNVLGFPITNYGVSVGDQTIPQNFSALTLWATKLEVIRHLIASYTEQPDFRNMATTYTDRRDYSQRWQAVLAEEKPEFERAVKLSKRSLLKLGRGSLLVAGGIYGGGANGMFRSGLYAAMTRSFRFYPSSAAISFGNQASGSPF